MEEDSIYGSGRLLSSNLAEMSGSFYEMNQPEYSKKLKELGNRIVNCMEGALQVNSLTALKRKITDGMHAVTETEKFLLFLIGQYETNDMCRIALQNCVQVKNLIQGFLSLNVPSDLVLMYEARQGSIKTNTIIK